MLINGNALSIPLADKSCQMCVTSPPYWGLRDYGTATWEGGDVECEHKILTDNSVAMATSGLGGSKRNCGNALSGYKDTCPKCGARRVDAQLGLESDPESYVANMVAVGREVWRVLRDDGIWFLNLGDSYASGTGGDRKIGVNDETRARKRPQVEGLKPKDLKPKDLVMIPARVALALQADGWWLRSDIIWAKPNPMPESVTDRPTTSHEHVFLLAKSKSYYYDADAVREANSPTSIQWGETDKRLHGNSEQAQGAQGLYRVGSVTAGRNKRTVWTIATSPYSGAHFAAFPPKLVEPMILAGTSQAGCCPECGAPWMRCVERVGAVKNPSYRQVAKRAPFQQGGRDTTTLNATPAQSITTGWEPTCDCGHDPVPCVVLDPFCGSGTVGVVCQELGREFVGIDLSWEYLQLARERTGAKAWDEWENGVTVDESDLAGLPLFEGGAS